MSNGGGPWHPLGEHMAMQWVYAFLPEPMNRTSFAFAWAVEHYGDLLWRLGDE